MITLDLRSGYHRFAWEFPGEVSIAYFVFTFLPFGLSSAPYIFTKCLKPLEKYRYWRFNDVNIALFLDDGWTVSPVRSELLIFGLI